jgi:hypothetical protein
MENTVPPTTTQLEGGAPVSEGLCNKMTGGKRKLTEWNKFVLKIFREKRKTNKKYSYGQALKEASALKKAGKMSMKKEPKAPAKKSGKKSGKKTMKCKKEYV